MQKTLASFIDRHGFGKILVSGKLAIFDLPNLSNFPLAKIRYVFLTKPMLSFLKYRYAHKYCYGVYSRRGYETAKEY